LSEQKKYRFIWQKNLFHRLDVFWSALSLSLLSSSIFLDSTKRATSYFFVLLFISIFSQVQKNRWTGGGRGRRQDKSRREGRGCRTWARTPPKRPFHPFSDTFTIHR
jgi:hypothetical protein